MQRIDFDPIEYLMQIKETQNRWLMRLREKNLSAEYIKILNDEMLEKYPGMVRKVVDDDFMDMEGK